MARSILVTAFLAVHLPWLRGPTAEDLVGEAFLDLALLSVYGAIPALVAYVYEVAAVHSAMGGNTRRR
jgi:hypothetical protein